MTLPEKDFKIKIGPFWYEVKYSHDIAAEGEVYGSTHSSDQKIFIDPDRPLQKREQTFVHEVFHACNFVNGMCYRFDEKEKKPSEEEVVRAMSMVFYQVLLDNPKIFGGK